jgi:hypothetical protein
MVALLTCETFEMINIVTRSHHHLERWNDFVACCTKARVSEQPQIVALAEHQIALLEECAADLSQTTVAATALQTVLMPQ